MPTMKDPKFRKATTPDFVSLGRVMFDAVRQGDSPYTEAQRAAWVPEPRTGQAWAERLSGQTILIAEVDDEIAGFMSLAEKDYLDFAYVLPARRGTGLFRALYQRIETCALDQGCQRIWVHASLMAEPAFARMGFRQLERETVVIGDEKLDRFVMEKQL